jgi:hypothetical protein
MRASAPCYNAAMRFFLGVVLGALLGGAAVYGWLERPWQAWLAADQVAAPDAGVETASREEPGKQRKRRRGRRAGGAVEGGAEVAEEVEIPTLTEADRALVWKGDAVALPPRQIDMAEGGESRSLDSGEINSVLRAQSGPMIDCIAQARGEAELDARIQVEMLVNGQGQPTRVRVRAPAYLFAHGFHACARKAMLGLRFPATGGHTVVSAPYDLH